MAGEFARLTGELDAQVMDTFNDGTADYLSSTGRVLAQAVPVIVEEAVERLDIISGAVDRVRTHAVQRHLLQPFDRKGAFVMCGKTWHIDGIASDDGQFIILYVVP
jgi:hypothetical protein